LLYFVGQTDPQTNVTIIIEILYAYSTTHTNVNTLQVRSWP